LRYFLELSYNGKAYHGWQNQPNAITVQEVLENALSTLLRTTIEIVGAGRTDTGVHALQMFAHFDCSSKLDIAQLKYNLNSFLPKDIAIQNIFEVKKDAHARFDAISRTYLYRICTEKDAFNFDKVYYINNDLHIDKMNEASKILFEYNNFECFSKTNTDVKTFNCKIIKAEWVKKNNELHFTIEADRFLRNMVRAIVGTLISVGTGKLEIEDMHTIIKSKNRSEAGYSVPAHGLYLSKIEYPEQIRL
jgi:tRNA pseudouridine38-40 synthase